MPGGPQAHAERCNADPDCQVIMDFPDGRDYPGAGAGAGRQLGRHGCARQAAALGHVTPAGWEDHSATCAADTDACLLPAACTALLRVLQVSQLYC